MAERWSVEQAVAMAPDAASAKAGRGLASERRWTGTGCNEMAVWGFCKGSGSEPYETKIELDGPAFACSCPSRKFPCKHSLGLLLLWAGSPSAVPQAETPDRVAEWLEARAKRPGRSPGKAGSHPGEEKVADPQARARRLAERERRVSEGIEELSTFLSDLIARGLAAAQRQPYSFWDQVAARMVDAQATGLAGRLRRMGGAAASTEGWPGRLLEQASLAHMLIEAYRRRDSLPDPLASEVRALIGWTVPQAEVLAGPKLRDRWQVMGQWIGDDELLRVSRTWLWGTRHHRPALILSFAHGGQSLDLVDDVGSVVDADLVFYPAARPLRALIAGRHGGRDISESMFGSKTVGEAMSGYAEILAENPWLERFPLALSSAVPVQSRDGWKLRDEEGAVLDLVIDDNRAWKMMSLSGGHRIGIFGEWSASSLRPLSVSDGRRVVGL